IPNSKSNLIIIERNPSETRLSELNIKCWPKWACPPGKYRLKFDAEETCYLLKGKVKAYSSVSAPASSSDFVEFAAGDLVIIPKGIRCTWDVSVAVDKYYKFEPSSSSASSSS
ncbi:Cupin_3 domain-containing protein, partial [Psidium guajava]